MLQLIAAIAPSRTDGAVSLQSSPPVRSMISLPLAAAALAAVLAAAMPDDLNRAVRCASMIAFRLFEILLVLAAVA